MCPSPRSLRWSLFSGLFGHLALQGAGVGGDGEQRPTVPWERPPEMRSPLPGLSSVPADRARAEPREEGGGVLWGGRCGLAGDDGCAVRGDRSPADVQPPCGHQVLQQQPEGQVG